MVIVHWPVLIFLMSRTHLYTEYLKVRTIQKVNQTVQVATTGAYAMSTAAVCTYISFKNTAEIDLHFTNNTPQVDVGIIYAEFKPTEMISTSSVMSRAQIEEIVSAYHLFVEWFHVMKCNSILSCVRFTVKRPYASSGIQCYFVEHNSHGLNIIRQSRELLKNLVP